MSSIRESYIATVIHMSWRKRLELRAGRLEVAVVTEDRKDKADHCAMTTACGRLSLPEMTLQEFLDGLDLGTR